MNCAEKTLSVMLEPLPAPNVPTVESLQPDLHLKMIATTVNLLFTYPEPILIVAYILH